MSDYKVLQVSGEAPRQWDGPHGTVYYIKAKLEGHDKPVSIGKKKPDALKVGDTVYGTIEVSDLPEDKFKPAAPPQASQSGQANYGNAGTDYKPAWQPRDDSAIQAQFAIKGAIELVNGQEKKPDDVFSTIEDYAKELFAMIDRVKNSKPDSAEPLPEPPNEEETADEFNQDMIPF